jgi:copper chaperone CopZ
MTLFGKLFLRRLLNFIEFHGLSIALRRRLGNRAMDLIQRGFYARLKRRVMLKKILKAYQERKAQDLVTARIGIKGMTDKNSVRTVKKALLTKSGVKHVLIDLKTGVASVTYDSNQTDVPSLEQIILRKGYFPEAAAQAA